MDNKSRWNRILKTEQHGREYINRIWENGYKYGHTCEYIHKEYLNWREKQKTCPRYVWSYLSGYYDAVSALYQKNHIRYMYMVDGKLYGIDRSKSDYYEKNGITPEQLCKLIGPINTIGDFYWDHLKTKF